jgi:hypothetical protein
MPFLSLETVISFLRLDCIKGLVACYALKIDKYILNKEVVNDKVTGQKKAPERLTAKGPDLTS